MSETVEVTNGDTAEMCTIVETYEHRGDTFAEVEGRRLEGFVQL